MGVAERHRKGTAMAPAVLVEVMQGVTGHHVSCRKAQRRGSWFGRGLIMEDIGFASIFEARVAERNRNQKRSRWESMLLVEIRFLEREQ